MKIGLSGAQGTGKSTLSKILAKELDLPLIEEQARIAAQNLGITKPSQDLKDKPEIGLAFELQCLILQLKQEEQYSGGFVSDRTLIDIAVYWNKWLALNAPATINRLVYDLCQRRANTYDIIIYTPPEFVPEDDNFRNIDLDYQAEMDFLVRSMIKVCEPPVVITVTGTVEQRVQQVLNALRINDFTNI